MTPLIAVVLVTLALRLASGDFSKNDLSDYVPQWQPGSAKEPTDHETQYKWVPHGYSGPLAIPEVRKDGTIADTPEVSGARAAHLAALDIARATNPDMDDGQYDPHKYEQPQYHVKTHAEDVANNVLFYGSLAKVQHTPHPTEANTFQWPAYTQAELSDKNHASPWKPHNAVVDGTPYAFPSTVSAGPLATSHILPSGYLADTLEVDAARKIHLSALAEATAAAKLLKPKTAQRHPWN